MTYALYTGPEYVNNFDVVLQYLGFATGDYALVPIDNTINVASEAHYDNMSWLSEETKPDWSTEIVPNFEAAWHWGRLMVQSIVPVDTSSEILLLHEALKEASAEIIALRALITA